MTGWQHRYLAVAMLCALMTTARATAVTTSVAVKVIHNTCTLQTAETLVALDTVGAASIRQGADIGGKAFFVTLKDCGADAKNVEVTVAGEADPTNANAFKNTSTASSAAAGVGLSLYADDGITTTLMKPDGTGQVVQQALRPGTDNTLHFRAAYTGTGPAVQAGDFLSSIHLILGYE
ncbi:type 1 fimbrial protein [Xanthomonas campestris pv. badrii]|uniref:Type 1 fimbrial protein n=1 Tax=Xanthomonas campestris pv. badrii TaxID=149696 RepID=A0A7Z2V7I8_XANCA|nr:fimbrial protein [Xanthomonas campestris]MCC4605474.1 type 1 fimbrial protein [Xanthomonas campestris pv. parthenii]QJD66499.1 type 1 fimbrial protein [Xanthomonas campestris pv. badrii]